MQEGLTSSKWHESNTPLSVKEEGWEIAIQPDQYLSSWESELFYVSDTKMHPDKWRGELWSHSGHEHLHIWLEREKLDSVT